MGFAENPIEVDEDEDKRSPAIIPVSVKPTELPSCGYID